MTEESGGDLLAIEVSFNEMNDPGQPCAVSVVDTTPSEYDGLRLNVTFNRMTMRDALGLLSFTVQSGARSAAEAERDGHDFDRDGSYLSVHMQRGDDL